MTVAIEEPQLALPLDAPEIPAEVLEARPENPLGVVALCVGIATGFSEIFDRFQAGKLPVLGEDRAPWEYRGWLLPYIVDPRPESRWHWWMEAQVTRSITSPPPAIEFVGDFGGAGAAARKNLSRAADTVRRVRHGSNDVIIDWLAWGLHVSNEPPRVDAETAEALYRTLNLNLWHEAPSDYLGWLMCEEKGRGTDPSGFYPTPHDLCALMAQMTFAGPPSLATVGLEVNDPCVGTGRTLLEASNWSARLSGQDIQRRCVLATLVNGAVYAPWMAWPLPSHAFLEAAA